MADRISNSTMNALVDLLRAFATEHGMSEKMAEHEARLFLDANVVARYEPHCRTEEDHYQRFIEESTPDDAGYDSHGNYHGD